ncbi:nucleoside deaminase [Methanobacterium ferruginis]|uniref:nucleoside deaminase n=1 Tax=Methanobacterium ferruginis TaxID=710191 RepID=UPI002572241E|nr:nucleoside deaminase [Methanobacterium ferruginis]BDZ67844.1 tRNA-specific adenosine deaminase [Methanobacterium ferruginis]
MESKVIKKSSQSTQSRHHKFMSEAQREAQESLNNGGIPVGAILVKNGEIIGRGHNKRIQLESVILHAEMECLENAGRMKADDYKNCTLYTTLSPCAMCSGAIVLYKIPLVVMGENENFKGPEKYLMDHDVKLINLNLDSCKKMFENFICNHPELWEEDIGYTSRKGEG